MSHDVNMKAKIDFSKVKTLNDLKVILESLNIEFDGPKVPDNMSHFVVPINDLRSRINFTKVKNLKDVKLILESLEMVFDADRVPENMKRMVITFDANAPIAKL